MNNKLTPTKITKLVCHANSEELVEQTVPSTALTLQLGNVYVFYREKSAYYDFFIIGGNGNDYGTTFYNLGCRMFTNPTSTGVYTNSVDFYDGGGNVNMRIYDTSTAKDGVEMLLFKDIYEVSL